MNTNILSILSEGDAHSLVVVSAADLKQAIMSVVSEALKSYSKKSDDVVTEDYISQKYGVSHATLWRWHKTGFLQKQKLGSKVLYRLSDVERILGGASHG